MHVSLRPAQQLHELLPLLVALPQGAPSLQLRSHSHSPAAVAAPAAPPAQSRDRPANGARAAAAGGRPRGASSAGGPAPASPSQPLWATHCDPQPAPAGLPPGRVHALRDALPRPHARGRAAAQVRACVAGCTCWRRLGSSAYAACGAGGGRQRRCCSVVCACAPSSGRESACRRPRSLPLAAAGCTWRTWHLREGQGGPLAHMASMSTALPLLLRHKVVQVAVAQRVAGLLSQHGLQPGAVQQRASAQVPQPRCHVSAAH
jgi:hypothetical protein